MRVVRLIAVALFVTGALWVSSALPLHKGKAQLPALQLDRRFQRGTDSSLQLHIPPQMGSALGLRVLDADGRLTDMRKPIELEQAQSRLDLFVSFVNGTTNPGEFTLLLFDNYHLTPFNVDGNLVTVDGYPLEIDPRTVLDIPITVSLQSPSAGSGSGHLLWVAMVRIPPRSSPEHPPETYFVQHVRYRVGEGTLPLVEGDTMDDALLTVSPVSEQGLDYELSVSGLQREKYWWNLSVGSNQTYKVRLRLRNKPGRYVTMVMLDDKPLPLIGGRPYIYWTSEQGAEYEFSFDLMTPKQAGVHRLYAISFENPTGTLPGPVGQGTSALYTLNVTD